MHISLTQPNQPVCFSHTCTNETADSDCFCLCNSERNALNRNKSLWSLIHTAEQESDSRESNRHHIHSQESRKHSDPNNQTAERNLSAADPHSSSSKLYRTVSVSNSTVFTSRGHFSSSLETPVSWIWVKGPVCHNWKYSRIALDCETRTVRTNKQEAAAGNRKV